MSILNKVTEPISEAKLGILSEWSLRIVLSYIFFSNGLPKLAGLIDNPGEPLGFVKNLYLFSNFPVISSYLAAIAELVLIPIFLLVGGLQFIGPTAKALSTLGGLLGTFVMVVVIFGFHFGVLGETFADVKYQLALFAMSIYFLFK